MKISYDNLLNKEFLLENYVEKKMTLAEIGRIIGCNNGEGLDVHHSIKPFIVILREFLNEYNQFSQLEEKDILARLASKYTPFWDLENGKTLCQDCHRGYMGKTFKEVLEFKNNIKGVL